MNLNELFLTHKGTRSYDDLARACDNALTSQRLQQIATTAPKAFPQASNIKAMARALGVTEVAVLLAAAESLGLDVTRQVPKLAQVLPAAASDLDEDQIAAIAHVIRAFTREGVGASADEAPTTSKPAAGPAKPPAKDRQRRAKRPVVDHDEAVRAVREATAFTAAARRASSVGKAKRAQQDKEAEAGGA